jgi:hypothetical protein
MRALTQMADRVVHRIVTAAERERLEATACG